MKNQRYQLGHSTLQVPGLTFGGNVFGWTVDEKRSFSLLDALLERDLNFIDTADVYSSWVPGNQGGESETIIGKWLKHSGKRDQIILATKVGKPMGEGKSGLSAAYINQAVEASLTRLQTDYIDLYQSHEDDLNTPLEETLTAFDRLIQQGKVRVIGASNYSAPRLAEALDISARLNLARYECVQPEYNLYDRADYEKALEPLVLERGIGVINYYALASGFLSGKYRTPKDASKSVRGEKVVSTYLNPRGMRILQVLDSIANHYRVSVTQVALAWQMARTSITAPIVSATTLEQIDDLANSLNMRLEQEEIIALDKASAY